MTVLKDELKTPINPTFNYSLDGYASYPVFVVCFYAAKIRCLKHIFKGGFVVRILQMRHKNITMKLFLVSVQ